MTFHVAATMTRHTYRILRPPRLACGVLEVHWFSRSLKLDRFIYATRHMSAPHPGHRGHRQSCARCTALVNTEQHSCWRRVHTS